MSFPIPKPFPVPEIWKDITGYEGFYQVSNMGRIKSLKRVIIKRDGVKLPVPERILQAFENERGYYCVCLAEKQIKDLRTVHRLVMTAFEGESDLQVNHMYGDKSDNRFCVLEYNTPLQNCNHRETVLKNKKRYGVTFSEKEERWTAQIVVRGRNVKLGRSKDKETAYQRFYEAYSGFYGVAPW